MMTAVALSPLLVCGVGRSGTSIVLQAIAEHRQVQPTKFLGEAPFIEEFVSFALRMESGQYTAANFMNNARDRHAAYRDLVERITCVPSTEDRRPDARYYPAKSSIPSLDGWEMFRRWFPQTKAIYVIRNGIEVIGSAKRFHGFKQLSFDELCRRWSDHSTNLSYLEAEPGVATVYHNELVADPRGAFEQIILALKLAPDSAPGQLADGKWFNSSFAPDGNRPIFRDRCKHEWFEWTDEQRNVFLRWCGPEMQRHGFKIPFASN